ncbi:MAG: 16S rRNA (guanine(966)-N(2))-methyltransferase RsmD [Marinicella sp.]
MGQIRITGGSHRSRKIMVEDQPGLRPTADRVRETLFNWLGHNLTGQKVLDLYSGSGILAFEAASRNAAQVTCIENNAKTVIQLRKNSQLMQFEQIKISQQSALSFIQNNDETYDLILLDPPFDSDEMNQISGIIHPLIGSDGLLYREYGADQDIKPLDEINWTLIKSKQAGQVRFELWQKI